MADNGDRPAFPLAWAQQLSAGDGLGLSKREQFAIQALVGMGTWMPDRSGPDGSYTGIAPTLGNSFGMQIRAEWAVAQADALLDALAKAEG